MRGYVTIDSSDEGKISVESLTEVYRDPDQGEQIVAEADGEVVPLGIADITVSRKKGDTAPVVLKPREDRIEIHNNGNSNGVTVDSKGTEREVAEGRIETVSSDATITIGYQTTLQLTTQQDAKIVNEGGTVVMGDDKSTEIKDSVLNRSNIGGNESGTDTGDGGTKINDSVVNRSEIGGEKSATVDNTTINRSTVGSESTPSDPGSVSDQTADTDSQLHSEPEPAPSNETQDTQFCIHCGTKVNATALYCPHCGNPLESDQVPETGTETMSATDTQQFCQEHELAYDDVCPKCDRAETS